MRRKTLRFGAAALFVVILIAGCASFPQPTAFRDSLLVIAADTASGAGVRPLTDILRFDGPTPVVANIVAARDGILEFRVLPGTYTLQSRTVRWRGTLRPIVDHYDGKTVQVPAATVVLFSWRFPAIQPGDAVASDSIADVMPADRRAAADALSNWVRFAEWGGRGVSGFAPYTPFTDYATTSYTVSIASDPIGAKLLIDGEDWGLTPLDVHLAAGKHFVRLIHDGYGEHDAFIDVEGNGSEQYVLQPASAAAPQNAASVTLATQPFVNLGSTQYDNLSSVLTSSLTTALHQAGLSVQQGKGTAANAAQTVPHGTAAAVPDFAAAEAAGVQAFVAGDYLANDQTILIHAALYDTRTHLVKASVIFNGKAGLDLFDSVDRMSAAFTSSVAKALPEVGQSIIQERVVTQQAAAFTTEVAEQNVIRQREQKHLAIELGPSLVSVQDSFVNTNGQGQNNIDRMNGPGFGPYMAADLPLVGALSLHAATVPTLFTDRTNALRIDLPLYIGARYTFSGFMSDIYVGMQGAVHLAQSEKVNFTNVDTPSNYTDVGPFLLTGLNFETGARVYTYQRLSQNPSFIGVGLTLGLIGYRFDFSGATTNASYPLEIGLRVMWGTRL